MADNLSRAARSYCMSRVRSRDTGPELLLRSGLHRLGFRFRTHASGLSGRPDIVLTRFRIAVFVDGDFWHGYRFPQWCGSLAPFWHKKISTNRLRDRRNFQRLRRQGWTVVRIWEHEIETNLTSCVTRIANLATRASLPLRSRTAGRSLLRVA